MAAKAGKDFLLKRETITPGTFATLGGLRSASISLNNEAIDATNHGSNQWKEILDGAGIRSMSISGSGIFTDDAALNLMIADAIAGTLHKYQIIDAGTDGYKFEGTYKVTSVERSGEYNGEQAYSISLESSGVITYGDATP